MPLIYAPSGDVRGPVVAIDWADGALGPTGKGCAVQDYEALAPGAIVVVRSGPCYRRDQILAAQEAGAAGFVAAYPQAGPGAALRPTLLDPDGLESRRSVGHGVWRKPWSGPRRMAPRPIS